LHSCNYDNKTVEFYCLTAYDKDCTAADDADQLDNIQQYYTYNITAQQCLLPLPTTMQLYMSLHPPVKHFTDTKLTFRRSLADVPLKILNYLYRKFDTY